MRPSEGHSLNEAPGQLPLAPQNTLQLPPTSQSEPQVSFDINLKDQVDYIDFDTNAYGTYLRKRGLTDAQVADTALQFDNKPLSVRPSYYDPDDKTAHVRIGNWRTEHTLNKAVGHETEHHINQLSGMADMWRPLTYASNIGNLIGPPLALTGSVLNQTESLDTPGKVMIWLGVIAIIGGQAAYYGNPDEISAHRAGHDALAFVTMRR
jgi:hypothetical protein